MTAAARLRRHDEARERGRRFDLASPPGDAHDPSGGVSWPIPGARAIGLWQRLWASMQGELLLTEAMRAPPLPEVEVPNPHGKDDMPIDTSDRPTIVGSDGMERTWWMNADKDARQDERGVYVTDRYRADEETQEKFFEGAILGPPWGVAGLVPDHGFGRTIRYETTDQLKSRGHVGVYVLPTDGEG